jgi:hypothetical protein
MNDPSPNRSVMPGILLENAFGLPCEQGLDILET